ncbi:MAG: glucoamylase family protein [Terriglobales bacterium]
MAQNTHLELGAAETAGARPTPKATTPDTRSLRLRAAELSANLAWLPGQRAARPFRNRCRSLSRASKPLLAALESPRPKTVSDDFRWLHDNIFLLEAELEDIRDAFKLSHKIPQVRAADGTVVPRIAALAEDFLAATTYQFSESGFAAYVQAFQELTPLKMSELWMLVPVVKLVLLEQIATRGCRLLQSPAGSYGVDVLVRSLREVGQARWKDVIEPLILFDHILREDPAGAYSRMDYDSRELYRSKLVDIADRSDCTEMEVASEALALASKAQEQANEDPRVTLRRSHVGSYLLAEGTAQLEQKVGFHPPIAQRLHAFLRAHPDEVYLPGIAVLTFAIVSAAVLLLTDPRSSLGLVLLSTLAVLLPSSQSAVQIMNYLATTLLPTEILPKLDFSTGLPDDCVTLVAIPAVLLNEKQVNKLAEDLEVRFLGNHDPNLHFALLTDLPDSPVAPREDSTLVDLCSDLIRRLQDKYAGQGMGSFLLLHRRRIYNPREQLWMGWERKRGKLMDLNNLLRGREDNFPRKTGNLSILPRVRFVITLDSDTELPRGAARRMVGALAHPLNQAILDPERGVVVTGYGILQPRVGVSVQSTARSRLASIYSGQTGFDIYTRAVSDVYQDLYGEGSFVGKGIYEVETLHRVLDGRFPRNALLSHDLVEGAYARAGLVSDIEVIEDYPSHYNAHNRRKHRWLRGDWQVAGWLRRYVPDESGTLVPNPLSVVSQWKILDNLRRSLVEPATFLLLVLGWLLLPGRPQYWTLATIAILFLPAWFQFLFDLAHAAEVKKRAIASDAVEAFFDANITDALTLTFLAHQALLSIDAVVRTIVRRVITRQRLLQWETAAQAELAVYQRTALDIYLDCTPALALGLFLLVWLINRRALPAALPVLLLWAFSKPVSLWLNRPSRAPRQPESEKDQRFLRRAALRIWRYFAEFSTEEHHWLIPDNVQEEPANVAGRISPTNLGLLLNARQVACKFGYLTVPEFVQQTLQTLETVSRMPRYRGHLLNWYDTRSLVPLAPAIVSTVDSGNLLASLWTLQRGCLELLDLPLLQPELADGFLDHLQLLASVRALPRRRFSALRRERKKQDWLQYLLGIPESVLQEITQRASSSKRSDDARWFGEQAQQRIHQLRRSVEDCVPWLLPQYAAWKNDPAVNLQCRPEAVALERLPGFIDNLALRLQSAADAAGSAEASALYRQLLSQLPEARSNVVRLIDDLRKIALEAGRLADEMDFGFLLDGRRRLLSVGFDVEAQQLEPACYDLLATESRIAVFTAIAKDDIPQESWFLLGRAHILDHGRAVLLSWTGTMFEYLMPTLWMRVYPNTLLERSAAAAVRSQRAYAADRGIPWGISESAYFRTDEAGNYQYYAFGIPQLAASKVDLDAPVISPYSSFLALHVDSSAALRNLRAMQDKQWLGVYGFYEAIDFHRSRRRSWFRRSEVVRSWMAHHQGMSLLSIANFLHDDVVQNWFHSHPRVQATELLLQEKPAAHLRPLRRTHNRIRAA